MVMLNASHVEVKSVVLPKPSERNLLSEQQLPPNNILDPLHLKGARQRVIAKAKQRLHDEMSAWPLEARRPGEISPAEDAALRELLVKGHTRSVGLPLPQEFVDRVKDPYTLYAIGVL